MISLFQCVAFAVVVVVVGGGGGCWVIIGNWAVNVIKLIVLAGLGIVVVVVDVAKIVVVKIAVAFNFVHNGSDEDVTGSRVVVVVAVVVDYVKTISWFFYYKVDRGSVVTFPTPTGYEPLPMVQDFNAVE